SGAAAIHSYMAFTYSLLENIPAAVSESELSVRLMMKAQIGSPVYGKYNYGRYLARNNQLDMAQKVANELKNDISPGDTTSMTSYWAIIAAIENAKGNTAASLSAIQKAAHGNLFFAPQLWLGRTYLDANKLAEGVAVFERLDGDYFILGRNNSFATITKYYLG